MHVDSHHNMTELICNLCDYVTKWNTLFHSHMREKHNVIKKNVKKTATATETGENNSKYLCDQCDFSTKSKQYLKMHVNSKHNGLALKCDMCDHTSTSNSNLKKHRDMKHFGKTYNCNVCDYKSKSNQYLTVHLKTHDPVAWQMMNMMIIDAWLWYLLFKYVNVMFYTNFYSPYVYFNIYPFGPSQFHVNWIHWKIPNETHWYWCLWSSLKLFERRNCLWEGDFWSTFVDTFILANIYF